MRTRNHRPLTAALGFGLAACMLAAGVCRTASAQEVTVSLEQPLKFQEFRGSERLLQQAERDWLPDLTGYIETAAAKRLPAGQSMQVTLTDLRRAGRQDPTFWRGRPEMRVVREADDPRINLRYRITDASGAEVKAGEAKLRDLAFMRTLRRDASEKLSFEKNLVDDWLKDVLPAP